MRFSALTAATFLLSGLTTVFAATFVVTVGKNATLLYDPSSVQAKVGDTISFQFMSKNHTVTQSAFDTPCSPKTDGISSGYQFIPPGTSVFPQWSITVTNGTAPVWFFCAQAPHCSLGMVFAINPTAEKTFDTFRANALASAPASSAADGSGYGSSSYGGGMGGGYGGSAPSLSATPTTPPTTVVAQGTAAAANVGTNSGAVGRAIGWPALVASIVMGTLVL